MPERRQHFRRRTLLAGRLEVAKLNGWGLDCSVRNVSVGGARVTIPGDVVVPQTVGLAISDQPQRPARLVWYREGQAGFALLDAPGDEHAQAPDSHDPSRADAAPGDRLAVRLAAITAGRSSGHFTRP